MSGNKVTDVISDIDSFEKREWSFEVDDLVSNNNEKDKFIRIKPSSINKVLDDFFEDGKPMGIPTGFNSLNPNFRWRRKGGLYVVTGKEQSGKSEFVKQLAVLRGINEGMKTVLFGTEEDPEDMIEDIAMKLIGKPVNKKFNGSCSRKEWDDAKSWIEKHFLFLDYDGMVDFTTLMKEYESLVKHGYKNIITDPFNYVAEGSLDSSGVKYLKTALSHLYTFSKRHNIWKTVVEHQSKDLDKNGKQRRATKDNIQGGTMWKHKATCIIVVHNNGDGTAEIEIAKNKNELYNGYKGSKTLVFDTKTSRFLNDSPDYKLPSPQDVLFTKPDEIDDVPF